MGLIVLHSGHFSKIFRKLMGTTCDLKWREADEKERIWVVAPGHPIVEGLGEYFELEPTRRCTASTSTSPRPDDARVRQLVPGRRGLPQRLLLQARAGQDLLLPPGHETYPTYYDPHVRRVIANAVRWAAPRDVVSLRFGRSAPLEEL